MTTTIINLKNEISSNELLGQYWTPKPIANYMVDLITNHIKNFQNLIICDPAIGQGVFLESLIEKGLLNNNTFKAFDIDRRMVDHCKFIANKANVNNTICLENYLLSSFGNEEKADIIIMNPPYIRHEKILFEEKCLYKKQIKKQIGKNVDGRSNLYIYFLIKSLLDLKEDGLLCAIVYDGLRNSLYGSKTLHIIESLGHILSIEKIETPFKDVIVDASILLVKRKKSSTIIDTYQIKNEKDTNCEEVTRIEKLIDIKRGTGLINSKLFMAKPNETYYQEASTFIKKQLYIHGYIVIKNHPEKAYLFDQQNVTPEFINWLKNKLFQLQKQSKKDNFKTLINAINQNDPNWYCHKPYKAPILFNYYIRNNPRHLYNKHLYPIADNFYGIVPKRITNEVAWILLNTKIYQDAIIREGRTQGNGLIKVQLYEYKNANVPNWLLFDDNLLLNLQEIADKALNNESLMQKYIDEVDSILKNFKFK